MLDQMRVVSFCHYLQGPACTQYLADIGADVIKVEPPEGAFERRWSGADTFVDGVSAFLMSANRNKRSLAIDLKRPEARAIMDRLIERADVIVENFRPGVMDRLGLGYDAVSKRKPEIIYASGTALGATGPAKDRPGQDLLMQARSGLMSVTGNHESGPVAVGAATVDQHGGALMAMGILAAYVKRLTTGKGTRIETSLFASGIDLQSEALTKYFVLGRDRLVLERDMHVGSWYHEAPYGVYRLADCYVALSMNEAAKVADALSSPRLAALNEIDRFQERDAYARALADELAERNFADVARAFDAAGVWYERVQFYDELREDPQAVHNQAFREVPVAGGERTATLVNHPVRYDGALPPYKGIPWEAGQHTREILAELGYEAGEIEGLVADAVVVAPAKRAKAKTDIA
ncbi:MAG: CaiB/BaiF CoA-transferase family protein [Rhodospirillales bacterium]|jgi:crotonobetainyl-CoA:carnitine CoA-transferase CaiB-like acyl-CoA transferase|nr:CaiB/BaiF CoA-transferase family protein [Rhodospirillales bacterium]MDP6805153.1 CaiB/BaiF CoA-transferase family protein [Rhodospirillales bacterium]